MSNVSKQKFDLSLVPQEFEDYVYEEERTLGVINCPQSVYMIVLALRYILTEEYTGYDVSLDFKTPQVFWRSYDEYGFTTDIILYRKEQEDYYDGDWFVCQEALVHKLASLKCRHGEGIIDAVFIDVQPYSRALELRGVTGVRRLIDDAALSMSAYTCVYSEQPSDVTWYGIRTHYDTHFGYELTSSYGDVHSVNIQLRSDPSIHW